MLERLIVNYQSHFQELANKYYVSWRLVAYGSVRYERSKIY